MLTYMRETKKHRELYCLKDNTTVLYKLSKEKNEITIKIFDKEIKPKRIKPIDIELYRVYLWAISTTINRINDKAY